MNKKLLHILIITIALMGIINFILLREYTKLYNENKRLVVICYSNKIILDKKYDNIIKQDLTNKLELNKGEQ